MAAEGGASQLAARGMLADCHRGSPLLPLTPCQALQEDRFPGCWFPSYDTPERRNRDFYFRDEEMDLEPCSVLPEAPGSSAQPDSEPPSP